MAKEKTTAFFCKECGFETAKWMGQCPSCRAWNSLSEEPVRSKKAASVSVAARVLSDNRPAKISEIDVTADDKVNTHMDELDRVLGGGIVNGSLVLVGGDPGIGKSTLLLQMCRHLSLDGHKVLYVSGEESLKQIKMRATRIGEFTDDFTLFCETNLTDIENQIRENKPEVVIIDSIQTMFCEEIGSAPGSVSQVREVTAVLLKLAKSLSVSIFIVGHVTKEGTVAGPRVLEHMVDTVLYFEGDRYNSYRVLRAVKNRFGSTNEIGVFEMRSEGLVEVINPSEYMLSGRPTDSSGSVIVCTMEGSRPLLIELQALVCQSSFGMPRRQATGVDINRVNLLMAVLEKRVNVKCSDCDAYINVAGGMKLSEPAIDLGIVMAIVSCHENIVIPEDVVIFGEVGLSGEVRAVSGSEQRIMEAKKLGFKKCIMPKSSIGPHFSVPGIETVGIASLDEALSALKSMR